MSIRNVFVVTVTYGNRFNLLKQVIDSALMEGVDKVIVVDNNSVSESKDKLREYEKMLGDKKIKVLYLDDNYGSAGGYKRGLEEAYKDIESEYILLLDDDTIISKNSLRKASLILDYLEMNKSEVMLGFLRPQRYTDKMVLEKGFIKKYKYNNFIGINLFDLLINKLIKNDDKYFIKYFPLVPAEISAWGGLFFHKNVIKKNGYPREDLIVYADDHEYTYRFTKNGGKLFICSNIIINDIDSTTELPSGKKIGYFDKEFSELKLYYQVRNHTYFSKHFIKNKYYFYINLFIYLILVTKNIFFKQKKIFFKRYKLVLKAIKDGINENLGKVNI